MKFVGIHLTDSEDSSIAPIYSQAFSAAAMYWAHFEASRFTTDVYGDLAMLEFRHQQMPRGT